MKKFLVATMLFCVGVIASAKDVVKPVKESNYTVNVSIGSGVWNDYSVKGTTVDGNGVSIEFAIEAMKEIKPNWYAGLGFGIHKLADGETKLGGPEIGSYDDYDSYPVYLTTKYSFNTIGDNVKPYVKADLGYAFNGRVKYDVMGQTGKEGVDNGLYAGIGFGIEQNNINIGAMFKTTQGEVDGHDADNYRFVLSVGYDFDFSF